MHLLNDDGDVLPPRELHPIFYGCFDWHSAVHGYWLLLRCLRLYPELSCRDDIITLFADHLTPEKVAQELAYFNAPFRASFERPYGYGWLLALARGAETVIAAAGGRLVSDACAVNAGHSQPSGGLPQ